MYVRRDLDADRRQSRELAFEVGPLDGRCDHPVADVVLVAPRTRAYRERRLADAPSRVAKEAVSSLTSRGVMPASRTPAWSLLRRT
jgi:hypothetical protein